MYKKNIPSSFLIIAVSLLIIFAYTGSRFITAEPVDAPQEETCQGECECELHDDHDDDENHEDHADETDEDHDVDGHDDHIDETDEDHSDHDEDEHDDHAGEIDEDHEDHAMDIQTEPARPGRLYSSVRLNGRIGLNQDNLAHIVPQSEGIVRQVNKKIGQPVKKDEVMAWIESKELGQAKIKYLDILAEIGCCSMLLSRSQNIHDNTLKLIELLKTNPTLQQIGSLNGMEIGENRSKLISSYAQYKISLSIYQREKQLFEQKITSKEEYLKSENELQKAEAGYLGLLDTIQFQVKQDLLEKKRDQQMMEISLKGSQRILMLLGLSQDDINRLSESAQQVTNPASTACTDPNCKECRDNQHEDSDSHDGEMERLGWYPLRSPFDGIIIDKHITLGERLGQESQAFTVADLDSVWVDLDVYQKDIHLVKTGQKVFIDAGNGLLAEGAISFISPLLDQKTRTASVRIVLDNSSGNYRPGTFVTANIESETGDERIILPRDAIQTVGGKKCVFIKHEGQYEPSYITTGRSNQHQVEVLSGIEEGQYVVTRGAFDLKAGIITSTLDDHAGHGH